MMIFNRWIFTIIIIVELLIVFKFLTQCYVSLYIRKVIFTNQNHKIHDHSNDTHQKVKVIEVPDELRRLYESQTGLEVQSTYFREPGAHVDTSNTVREFAGRLLSKDSGSETIVFHFDFDKQHYAQNSISGKNKNSKKLYKNS